MFTASHVLRFVFAGLLVFSIAIIYGLNNKPIAVNSASNLSESKAHIIGSFLHDCKFSDGVAIIHQGLALTNAPGLEAVTFTNGIIRSTALYQETFTYTVIIQVGEIYHFIYPVKPGQLFTYGTFSHHGCQNMQAEKQTDPPPTTTSTPLGNSTVTTVPQAVIVSTSTAIPPTATFTPPTAIPPTVILPTAIFIPPTAIPTDSPPVIQPTLSPSQPVNTANIIIQSVFFDGAVYRTESDEYAVIANVGAAPVNLKGWRLNAGDAHQDFMFPAFELQSGQNCRVYTNEVHPESCGFSFRIGRAIWNNTDGDCGYLYNASGVQVSHYCYGSSSTPSSKPQGGTVPPVPTENPQAGQRYGAICKDGWRSNATGSGACSHHGGVDHWLVY